MSLREALENLARSARLHQPEEVQRVIDRALADLSRSGIATSCLQAGETAPDFELEAADGGRVSLESALRDGPVILTFYRGGWCPYCNLALRALNQMLPALRALGARLLAISPQRAAAMREIAAKHGLRFPLLSDPANRVGRLFGLTFRLPDDLIVFYREAGLDLAAANGAAEWELPLPATYVVARDGTVAQAFIDIDYAKRAEPADIVAAVERLAKEPVT
ncbi:MAG: AhpC/TSA family protein [Alphaproteobacteria bacterium]|nr:AhpC/TSA family protein [Alphaproteobacteria bacterium]